MPHKFVLIWHHGTQREPQRTSNGPFSFSPGGDFNGKHIHHWNKKLQMPAKRNT